MKHTTDPQAELLTRVDQDNQIIGSISRKLAHNTNGVIYRTIYILVFDKDKVLLQKRSPTKDLFPNCWDLSVGGHVNFGHTYLETAVREIKEELGLTVAASDLVSKGNVLVSLPKSREYFEVFEYYLKPSDRIRPSHEEVAATLWMSVDQIRESIKEKSLNWYQRPIQVINAIFQESKSLA